MTRFAVRALMVLWPAFFTAGVMTMLVFAMIDPSDLHWIGGEALPLSRQATYSLAFLAFWALIGSACAVTLWLANPGRGAAAGSPPETAP
jgi:hypothetical protein